MNQEDLLQHRQQKDHFFKTNAQSPLTLEQKVNFKGLNYYDYNLDLDMTVTATPFEQQETLEIITTTSQVRNYVRYAEFIFMVDDKKVRLTIFKTDFGYFLPFVDANSGTETYPAGRYIEPETSDGITFHIDFNLVYNPFCAYNDAWSCPITPFENRVGVAIRAGEKLFR
jgi:uncharacterized protein